MFDMETLRQGGTVVYLILAASLVSVGYIVYCLIILRRAVILPAPLVEIARTLARPADCGAALARCRETGGPFAEVLATVIAARETGRSESEALIESAGRRAAHDLSHGVLALEIVAAISPLLGLLGTVIGMHRVFSEWGRVEAQQVAHFSGGISEALITTICGLVVAIPAYVFCTYFSRRVDDLVLEMERHAVELMVRLRAPGAEGD